MKKIYNLKNILWAFAAFSICLACSQNDEPTKEEEKLNIVSKIKSGYPIESLGRTLGICPKDIRT